MFNWYKKLNAFLSPSIYSEAAPTFFSSSGASAPASAAQIAAELAKINPTLTGATKPTPINYKPNPFTIGQLNQFSQARGLMQSNPYAQQYLNKMNAYGAGQGNFIPSYPSLSGKSGVPTTEGSNNG